MLVWENMARVLLFIVLVWILYVVIKRILAKNNTEDNSHSEKPAESIVQCAKCGLHVPESESHISNNLVICNNPKCNRITKTD